MDDEKKDNVNETVHGGDVYRNEVRLDFSVNLNPLEMPAPAAEAIMAGLEEIHQYPDPKQQKLRESIASFEGLSPEHIICGNGASELIMAAVHAVKPKKALVTAPCYAGYAAALMAEDAVMEEYPLREENGFALDEGMLERIAADTDIVFVTDPNNPNGKLISTDLKKEIAGKCAEHGAVLVIDECFLPLTGEWEDRKDISDGALHLRAFTKTFAIPGIRLGYMVSRDRELLESIRRHLPEWNVSRIAERTGEAAAKVIAETDYIERSVRMIREERAYLAGELAACGIRVYPGEANYLLIRSAPDLYDRLLAKGILIRRCANFSGLDETYFRIAVRRREENEALIKAIGEVL